ncbi:MAG: LysR family transcriptional regulator [Limibacillus sp.]
MQELNYHHLRYFQAVAHEGNLTRAAEQLNVAQSALSSQIRQLEERLGQALFERRGRALHLTEAGRIALEHADTIFAAGKELVSTLTLGPQARRPLKIGAIATLSRTLQLAFLIQLDLVLTNHPPDRNALSPFIVHRLAEQPVGLIGIPSLSPPRLSLAERLASAPLVLPAAMSGPRADFDALVSRLNVTPKVAAEVDDMAMARLLARDGVGLAVIPPIVVKDELASGRLVNADTLPGISETFYAVTKQRKYPNPLVQGLLGPIEEEASGER